MKNKDRVWYEDLETEMEILLSCDVVDNKLNEVYFLLLGL